MKNRTIKFYAIARRWFDRANGNTYHSVKITRARDGKTIYCPWDYGYGDEYRYTGLDAMDRAGWLPKKYRGRLDGGFSNNSYYEQENNYPILWSCTDGLKRDMVENGTEPGK